VQVRYVLAPDDEFTTLGARSRISYLKTFNEYLDIAKDLQGIRSGRATIAWWNQVVFAGSEPPLEVGGEVGFEEVDDLRNEIAMQRELEEEEQVDQLDPEGELIISSVPLATPFIFWYFRRLIYA